ncbi:MAG: ribosome small subunit-dependent GTPase A [Chloroflexi bacterium]|nr:ribosome small subunit-dependent GTPase A [Chloroflexota bacterium]
MPRGEKERRREVEKLTSLNLMQGNKHEIISTPSSREGQGLVTEVGSGNCKVSIGNEILVCSLRGALKAHETGYTNIVVVGDEVLVNVEDAVVETLLPRRSLLTRPDVFYTHLQQIVVANVDQVLIVASWQEPHFWPELVDRYLIAAEVNQLQAVICLNKIDLVENEGDFQNALQPYHSLDLPIIFTSAKTKKGISELQTQLHERTTVLAGLSGVGKSTLLSAVQPDINLRTGDVGSTRKYKGMGRHTTSQATLLKLEKGGAVVDTPGIREFGLANVHQSELISYFSDMSALAEACRYSNCSHVVKTNPKYG